MDSETDKNKPETPYKFCATTFLAAAGILLGATSALSAFLGNNLSKVIGVFLDDNLSIEETALILTATVFCLMFVAGFVVLTILFIHCIKQYWNEANKAVSDYALELAIQRNKEWIRSFESTNTSDDQTAQKDKFNSKDLELVRDLVNKITVLVDLLTEKIEDNKNNNSKDKS